MAAALVIGLLTGFAAGFFAGREDGMISAPPSAAPAVAAQPVAIPQPHSYTDAPVVEQQDAVLPTNEVEHPPGAPGEPDKVLPTIPSLGGPGSLQIVSRPSGAQVYVDDVRVGVTPMSMADVSTGVHRIRIELPGFRQWATSVNVVSGVRARVGASLER